MRRLAATGTAVCFGALWLGACSGHSAGESVSTGCANAWTQAARDATGNPDASMSDTPSGADLLVTVPACNRAEWVNEFAATSMGLQGNESAAALTLEALCVHAPQVGACAS
jgi:hypothetical protein